VVLIRRARPPKRHRILLFLRDATIICAITLVLTEISLRIYHRFDPLPIFYTDSYNQFRGKPFARVYDYRLNSNGFHDVERKVNKDEGTFRILGIGDSFSFGVVPHGYNYLTLLEHGLNRQGLNVEVVNMGIPGANTIDYLGLLVREGIELRPDMVLLSFFIGNDFLGARTRYGRTVVKYGWPWSHSYIATAVSFLIAVRIKLQPSAADSGARWDYDDNGDWFQYEAFLQAEREVSKIFVKENKEFELDFSAALANVLAMEKICDEQKIRLSVVLIPDEVQVSWSLREKVIAAYGLPPESFDFTLPNRLLGEALRKHGIDYLDLFDEFAAASAHVTLYRPNDTHWNIKGNSFASELIQRHLLPQLRLLARR
jgi:hypothetical protein